MCFPTVRLCLVLSLAGAALQAIASDMLVSNYFGNNVLRFSMKTGQQVGSLTGATLNGPLAVTLGPDGKLYVASEKSQTILKYDLDTGGYLGNFAKDAGMNDPTAIFFDKSKTPFVANFKDSSISKFSKAGVFESVFVAAGTGGLKGPDVGAVFGPDGDLYVPSFYNSAILLYDGKTGASKGYFVKPGADGLKEPRTIIFREGKVWVSCDGGNKVLRFKPDGTLIDVFIQPGAGGLKGASGMAFGEDGYLYVASGRTNQVLRYDAKTGDFKDVFIGSGLNGPVFIAIVPSPRTRS